MKRKMAMRTSALLSTSLRATDYIGWHQEGYVLGALLTMLHPDVVVDSCHHLKIRLEERLCGALSFTDDYSLHVQVHEQIDLSTFNRSHLSASLLGSQD